MAYLLAKSLLGETVRDPVLVRPLVDMTRSVSESRAEVV